VKEPPPSAPVGADATIEQWCRRWRSGAVGADADASVRIWCSSADVGASGLLLMLQCSDAAAFAGAVRQGCRAAAEEIAQVLKLKIV
jgi:hypothetical protein